jgi:putative heme-binding domain-containing protein
MLLKLPGNQMPLVWKMTVSLAIAWLAATGLVAQGRGGGRGGGGGPAGQEAAAIALGSTLYRERCAECHGADAKGVAGHDLTRLWTAGATDQQVFQTIRNGVPNTIMPSSAAPDGELRAIVAYLKSLNEAAEAAASGGDAENGQRIFWATCGNCHAVNGRGGRLGPDQSRIAQSRLQLTQAIRNPSASIPAGYQPVTLMTREGQNVRGVSKGEDAFSIQIMDTNQRLQGYLKSTVTNIVREDRSLMPEFGPDRVNDGDLNDLLAFLATRRPSASNRP